jgi:hypothetical protein
VSFNCGNLEILSISDSQGLGLVKKVVLGSQSVEDWLGLLAVLLCQRVDEGPFSEIIRTHKGFRNCVE